MSCSRFALGKHDQKSYCSCLAANAGHFFRIPKQNDQNRVILFFPQDSDFGRFVSMRHICILNSQDIFPRLNVSLKKRRDDEVTTRRSRNKSQSHAFAPKYDIKLILFY